MGLDQKSADNLKSSDLLLAESLRDPAVGRAYYAVYQAAWACMGRLHVDPDKTDPQGRQYWSHDGLPEVAYTHVPAIDDDLLDKWELLYERRVKADYLREHLEPIEADDATTWATQLCEVLSGHP